MEKECLAFQMRDPRDAWKHMKCEIVKNYGEQACGHMLHTWDDGGRYLARCRNCGGYILIQQSEYHGIGDGDDDYYTDYFPVCGAEDAEKYNRLYDGYTIELSFPKRYLMKTNLKLRWSEQEKNI